MWGPAGSMRIAGDVEGYLCLIERDVYAAFADQLASGSENAAAAAERAEEGRRLIRGLPVEVVAHMPIRRRSLGDQSVDLVVHDAEDVGCDEARDHNPTSCCEGADPVGGQTSGTFRGRPRRW